MSSLLYFWNVLNSSAVRDNPDARLQHFKTFFAASSDNALPVTAPAWLTVALMGVCDVWSVIRKLAARSVAQAVDPLRVGGCATIRFMDFVSLAAKHSWFHTDGFLLLGIELWRDDNADALRVGDKILTAEEKVQFTLQLVIPFALHSMPSIREASRVLLKSLAKDSLIKKTLTACLLTSLKRALVDVCSSEADIEGSLALAMDFPDLHRVLLAAEAAKQMPLASHSAASVRQLFADFLSVDRKHGIREVEGLLGASLSEFLSGASACDWKRVETLLMAFNAQITGYCNSTRISRKNVEESHGAAACKLLCYFVEASAASVFEVRRMAQQIVPIYCQFLVRRHSAAFITNILMPSTNSQTRQKLVWYLMLKKVVAENSEAVEFRSIADDVNHAVSSLVRMELLCPIQRVIVSCYSSAHRCLATSSDWEVLLADATAAQTACRYAMDFALVSPNAPSAIHLWAAAVPSFVSEPHLQLIVIEAIRVAVLAEGTLRQQFQFSINKDLRAPCIMDGGDGVVEGFFWLHSAVPSLPLVAKSYTCHFANASMQRNQHVDPHQLNDSQLKKPEVPFESLKELFSSFIISPNIEPRIVIALYDLLLDAYAQGACTMVFAVKTIVSRLNMLHGFEWMAVAALMGQGDGVEVSRKKSSGNSFDDSDDDETVSGLNCKDEVTSVRRPLCRLAAAANSGAVRDELRRIGCSVEAVHFLTSV